MRFADYYERHFCKIQILIGLFFGFFFGIALQDGLYNSQIVAGLIGYNPEDTMYIWGNTNWSLIAQIPALLLKLGLNDIYCNLIVSLLISILSFLSLGIIFKTITNSSKISFLLSLFSFYSIHYLFGSGYEVSMISWKFFNSTLGMTGFHFCVLVLAFFWNRSYSIGFFLLGTSLSVHIFQSFYIHLFIGLLLIYQKELLTKKNLSRYLLGLSISIISFVFFYLKVGNTISNNLSVPHEEMKQFISLWDDHRLIPIRFYSPAFISNFLFFPIIYFLNKKLSIIKELRIWSLFCFLSAILLFVLANSPLSSLSTVFMMSMPEKMLGFGLYLNLMIIISILLKDSSSQFFFSALSISLIILFTFIIRINNPGINLNYFPLAAFSLILFCLVIDNIMNKETFNLIIIKLLLLLFVFFPTKDVIFSFSNPHSFTKIKRTYSSDFAKFLSSTDKYIIVAPSYIGSYIQMISHKKILFDPGELSDIPYSPASYKFSNKIMKDIYQVDLLKPSAIYMKHHKRGLVSNRYIQSIWESRTFKDWENLKAIYHFNFIVVPKNWKLRIKNYRIFSEGAVYYF